MKEFSPPGVANWAIGWDITEERRQRDALVHARCEAEQALQARASFWPQ